MPVYSPLISPNIFTNILHQSTKRSATYLKNITDSDLSFSLYKLLKQKDWINELLRFLKKMAASKPTL